MTKELQNLELLDAGYRGNVEKAKLLLKDGFSAEEANFWGNHSVNFAAMRGHSEMANFLKENGFMPNGRSANILLVEMAERGFPCSVDILLDKNGQISENAWRTAFNVALKKKHLDVAVALLKHRYHINEEDYIEYLKKTFLKAAYLQDKESVLFTLEKLIENAVGVLTDESGKSTLEIAMGNPADIIKILSNYGFHENSLHYAYRCLSNL